ncbi:MAG: MBL fold metallo-hydrolase [Candidatus Lokiarchaeota archaeon]|nr:MBL fold metallo-hydrolase [Candidatus Lokiarchaeota archaeon]
MVIDIFTKSGKINDYIHHVDLEAFERRKFLSCYIAEFDNCSIILDCGSSLDIDNLLNYINRAKIPLSSIKYLITTHYHFDHNGGAWKLCNFLEKYNPNFKIITNYQTKVFLNNPQEHLARAKRTFGNFIGDMNYIEDNAFKLIEPINKIKDFKQAKTSIEDFSLGQNKISLGALKTPGHTLDHQCPFFIRNGKIEFLFLGEAAGTLYNSSNLKTMPTSMPIHFNYDKYMNSFENIMNLKPKVLGFAHFGVLNNYKDIKNLLNEHKTLMEQFRKHIIKYYRECPKTEYIYDKIMPQLIKRTDLTIKIHPLIKKIILAVIYGMLMDLGYRKD